MGEAENWRRRRWVVCLATALLCGYWVSATKGDFAADQQECAPSLTGLMTCLDYVEGRSDSPPLDCCSGLKQVIVISRRCLCILIKDRHEPQLPFKINSTRAIFLPSICQSHTNITQCIDILKLDPSSGEAQIFKPNGWLYDVTPGVIMPTGSGGESAGFATGGAVDERKRGGGLWIISAMVLLSSFFY